MARGIPRYLQSDETVLAETDRHRASVIDELIGIVVFSGILTAGLLVFIVGFRPDLWWPIGGPALSVIWLLAAWTMLIRWWRTITSEYTLTDTRVYRAYGRLRWSVLQTTFDKLTDLQIQQGIFGRLLGYGTIRLETAGSGMVMAGVRDPFGFKQEIENARTQFLQKLVGDAPHSAPPAYAANGASADTPQPEGKNSDGAVVSAPPNGTNPLAAAPTSNAGNATHSAAARPAGSASTNRSVGMGSARWQSRPATSAGVPTIIGGLALFTFGLLLFGSMLLVGTDTNPYLFLLPVIYGIFITVRAIIFLRCTQYYVHDGGVVVTSGWLTRRRVEATYSKVTDVATTQSLLGRILGFGEIRINTAGSNDAPIVFQGVANPDGIKRLVDEARNA